MESGVSWSGHERNRAWINLGDGTFADVSAIAGFDQIEDGRVVVQTDWDGDGDMDLWLRSRNGPTLRYLENTSTYAKVARVQVEPGVVLDSLTLTVRDADSRETTRSFAGRTTTDGYLGSGRAVMTMGLREEELVTGISFSSNNSSSSMSSSGSIGLDFSITKEGFDSGAMMGSGNEDDSGPQKRELALSGGALSQSPLPTRIVLRSPLPMPQTRASALLSQGDGASADAAAGLLVIVRSATCPTCEAVIPAFLEVLNGAPEGGSAPSSRGNLGRTPVIVDMESQDEMRHGDFIHAAAASVLGPGAELALPLSALMDRDGNVQVLYSGALDASTVLSDYATFAAGPIKSAERSGFGPPGSGPRWFHGAPRSFEKLRTELLRIGLDGDATAYPGATR